MQGFFILGRLLADLRMQLQQRMTKLHKKNHLQQAKRPEISTGNNTKHQTNRLTSHPIRQRIIDEV